MSEINYEGAFLAQNSYYMADFCVATLSISSINKCGNTSILANFCVATLQFWPIFVWLHFNFVYKNVWQHKIQLYAFRLCLILLNLAKPG